MNYNWVAELIFVETKMEFYFGQMFQNVSMQLTRTQIDEKILGVNLSAFVMTTMTFLKTTLIPAVLSRNYKR